MQIVCEGTNKYVQHKEKRSISDYTATRNAVKAEV